MAMRARGGTSSPRGNFPMGRASADDLWRHAHRWRNYRHVHVERACPHRLMSKTPNAPIHIPRYRGYLSDYRLDIVEALDPIGFSSQLGKPTPER